MRAEIMNLASSGMESLEKMMKNQKALRKLIAHISKMLRSQKFKQALLILLFSWTILHRTFMDVGKINTAIWEEEKRKSRLSSSFCLELQR